MKPIVLIVDDEPSIREILVEAFKSNTNFYCLEAANPLQALDFFHQYKNNIRFIITDFLMPVDDGLELCRLIRHHNQEINLILFTGHDHAAKDPRIKYVNKVIHKADNWPKLIDFIEKCQKDRHGVNQ